MNRTMAAVATPRIQGGPSIVATAAALRTLRWLCRHEGPVALVHLPSLGGLLCLGAADFVPGPNDVRVTEIAGCPVFMDVREDWASGASAVLDVEADPEPGRPSPFVLRPGGPPAKAVGPPWMTCVGPVRPDSDLPAGGDRER